MKGEFEVRILSGPDPLPQAFEPSEVEGPFAFGTMHYVFVDEKYQDTEEYRTIVVAAWAADQATVNSHLSDLRLPGKASLLARINVALERLNALAFVGRADLSRSLFRAGEIDSCDGIPSMARADTIWSMATVFVVGALLRDLCLAEQTVNTLDLFFDPRDLKLTHRVVWEETLRSLLAREAKRFASQINLKLLNELKIRRIEFVDKTKPCDGATKFQLGTEVAHRICSRSHEMFDAQRSPRINCKNMSDVITRTVRQWDGVPYDLPDRSTQRNSRL